MFYQKMTVGA